MAHTILPVYYRYIPVNKLSGRNLPVYYDVIVCWDALTHSPLTQAHTPSMFVPSAARSTEPPLPSSLQLACAWWSLLLAVLGISVEVNFLTPSPSSAFEQLFLSSFSFQFFSCLLNVHTFYVARCTQCGVSSICLLTTLSSQLINPLT